MRNQTHENKALWGYFILTYAIALLTWGIMIVFQIPGAAATSTTSSVTPIGLLLMFVGGFSPSIAGFVITWRTDGRQGLKDLWQRTRQVKFGWKWYAAMLLVPFLSFAIQVAVQVMRGEVLKQSGLLTHPTNLIGFTLMLILGGALAEEFGWRGFALDRLLNRWNIWVSSLFLGIIWVFWHLPLFFIPGTIQASRGNILVEFSIFALWIMALAVLFGWIYAGTGRSLFAALLFHLGVDWFQSFSGTIMNGDRIDRLVHAIVFTIAAVVVLAVWNSNRRLSVVERQAIHA